MTFPRWKNNPNVPNHQPVIQQPTHLLAVNDSQVSRQRARKWHWSFETLPAGGARWFQPGKPLDMEVVDGTIICWKTHENTM